MTTPTPAAKQAPVRILCVDDEPRVLDALERMLRGRFTVVTAAGPGPALEELQRDPRFAVVMSDLRMPGMSGIELLRKAGELAPDAVRVLLTGHAELETAIEAVNHGHVFQFLRKPCHPQVVVAALRAAAEQHRLVTAERELLEHTLRGSVRALAEVLALVSPAAFGRAERVRRMVGQLAHRLSAADPWSIEVAATIWHLGCVTLSPSIAERIARGVELDAEERELIGRLPAAAARLIAHIPRLESVRDLLEAVAEAPRDEVPLGAQLLRAVLDLDTLEARGFTLGAAFDALDVALAGYDVRVLTELRLLRGVEGTALQVREMPLAEVTIGMIFADDVVNQAGLLLIARGQEVTIPLLDRVRTYWAGFAHTEMVRMIVRPALPGEPAGAGAGEGETPTVEGAIGGAACRAAADVGDPAASAEDDSSARSDATGDAVTAGRSTASVGRSGWWR